MNEELSKEYYIQEKELCVLLALKGQTQLYGIHMDGVESIDQGELYKLMFIMLKKGILSRPETTSYDSGMHPACHIEKQLECCIDLIKQAENFVVFAHADETVPERYFYVAGTDAVILQPAGQGGFLHMKQITKDAMWKMIKENIAMVDCGEATDRMYDVARECWQDDKDTILKRPSVKLLLQEYIVATQCKNRQIIQLIYGLDEFLIGSDKDKCWTINKSEEKGETMWF